MSTNSRTDHWDSDVYSQKVAPYVPELTEKVVQLLEPGAEDLILDIGCGDGVLTSKISHHVNFVLGIDASPNMISGAETSYATPNAKYLVLDAGEIANPQVQVSLKSHIPPVAAQSNKGFTKLFSNAALHWILRPLTPLYPDDLDGLTSFFKGAYNLLAPGGYFVSESGALGNVAEVNTAFISALVHQGIPALEAREATPWLFPSTGLMTTVLKRVGFIPELVEIELRQTDMVGGDVEGWVRLFGAIWLEKVKKWVTEKYDDQERGKQAQEEVIREVVQVLEGVGRRIEDGGFVLNYIRLRVKARKP